jgi:hypothetical protein
MQENMNVDTWYIINVNTPSPPKEELGIRLLLIIEMAAVQGFFTVYHWV